MLIMSSAIKKVLSGLYKNVEQLFKEAISTDFKGFSALITQKKKVMVRDSPLL